jgi:hypothetical protein
VAIFFLTLFFSVYFLFIKRIKEWEDAQIKKYTDKDYISVMMKLREAAFNWDPTNHIESVFVRGFEAFLSPFQFKLQIEKSFNIKLTGAEIGSLVAEFTTRDGDYCVDGYLFLKRFASIQRQQWEEHQRNIEIFRKLKEKTMEMGQNSQILPKSLGR